MLKKLMSLLLVTTMMLSSVAGVFATEAKAASSVIDMIDFTVEVEEGRMPRVLQISDTQIIDSSQMRTSDRLSAGEVTKYAKDNIDELCFDYVRPVVEDYDPDLIIIAGDFIYGEFDDDGTVLQEMIEFFDSLQKPWAVVFGNHDVESKKGADWQCEQLENSEYCLFKQRELTGNGNYTVGIVQGGELKRVFFMLDSNGTKGASDESMANGHTKKESGFGQDQIDWYEGLMADIKAASPNTKLSAAFHIQLATMGEAIAQYGSQPLDLYEKGQNGDYGYINENLKYAWDGDKAVYNGMKNLGVDSMFNGHVHTNNGGILYDGIRFVYGLKSGTYDYHNTITADGKVVKDGGITPYVGGTAIDLNQDGSINNVYHILSSEAKEYVPEKNMTLFEETFEEGFASKTEYGMNSGISGPKTGVWSTSEGNDLSWNYDGDEGKIYAGRGQKGGMQFLFADGQEYTDEMVLEVTADVLAGAIDKTDYCRVDVIGSIENDGHHRITLCNFSGGKIYANTMSTAEARDTGATYEAGKRYIVKGFIYEANETFKLSVYDKETGEAVLQNYTVTPYKHDKSNWQKMTAGFKGINFYANREQSGSPAYSLYSISAKNVVDSYNIEQSEIILKDETGEAAEWDDVDTKLSTVSIDFGTAMNQTTLTEDTIYIENTDTNGKVSYTPSYENNIYTLTLDEELSEGTIYNIVITTDVETAEGGRNSEEKVFEFKTSWPEIIGNTLFEETFEEGFKDKTKYNGRTGVWLNSEGSQPELLWNYDGGEGKIYANQAKVGGMQFNLNDGKEYTEVMKLKVTADVLTGPTTNTSEYCRVDLIGLNETEGDGRVSVSFSAGKIYANCMHDTASRDTGATYESGKRYMVEGIIDEENQTFTLSVYDKETGNAVLENYNVTPYKHDKSNWYAITNGFKGINFYTNRSQSGRPAYSLYSIKVEIADAESSEPEVPSGPLEEVEVSLFEETFDEGYESKTAYNGKTGAWSYTDGSANLSRNSDDGEGKIYAARNQASAMQFKFDDGQEYTDVMKLKVTADILTGPTDKDSCRVDIIGSIESDGHHRVTLCSLSGGKFYVNCMGTATARDTGATYKAATRYIVEGIIYEENKTFTVSIYEKDTGDVVLENYNVTPYDHDKSNWYEITHGLKGVYFRADRTGNGSPAYSLYSIKVSKIQNIPAEIITEAVIESITLDGTPVTSVAQIATGDKLTVTVDYRNTTGKDKTLYLIIASYDEYGILKKFGYVTKDMDKSVTEDNVEIESNELNMTDADMIKVMVWDGFDTLNALSPIETLE